MKPRILIVDDELDIRSTLAGILEDEGFQVRLASEGAAALRAVRDDPPDMVLLDIWMPGMDGLEVLTKIKDLDADLPVVMISGHGNVETAVKATKLGAYDFLEKPLSLDLVILTTRNVMDMLSLRLENRKLHERLESRYEIIGESAAIRAVNEQVRRAAPSESRLLITGENGTGKELVARQVHRQSPRADKPFIEVNCAAIPEELIESELFGHEKGAFTGATAKRRGKFDLADGGTIFLDEIADMSLRTQAKILRILQEQKFERVGGVEAISVDVRVIAATNKDLSELIRKERFREDLYFRLNVIPIHVPPLRERREDIPKFVDYFMGQYCVASGARPKVFTTEALDLMGEYSWPGNVRELKNIVERLMIMTPGRKVTAEEVESNLKIGKSRAQDTVEDFLDTESWREAKARFERSYLVKKLADHDGNVSQTARAIGVERSHLHRLIKALNIET